MIDPNLYASKVEELERASRENYTLKAEVAVVRTLLDELREILSSASAVFWTYNGPDPISLREAAKTAIEKLRAYLDDPGSGDIDTPKKAWARGFALARATFHQHAKLDDNDPLWELTIPEYIPPEAT